MVGPRGIKSHPCPKCGKMRHFKRRSYYRHAIIHNTVCKRCAYEKNKVEHAQRSKDYWANLSNEEREKINKKRSLSQKRRLANMTEKERKKVIERGTRSLRNFRIKLKNPKVREKWLANLRKSFDKYRGDKHWTNRPDTYLKIVDSSKKYCGEGHWFKRPAVKKRWDKAMRKRYAKNE